MNRTKYQESTAGNDPPRTTEGASVFAVAVLIGALALAVAESLPGGLTGGVGFALGVLVSFVLLSGIVLFARVRSKPVESQSQVECPYCGRTSKVALNKLPQESLLSNGGSADESRTVSEAHD